VIATEVHTVSSGFEQLYLAVRQKEKRIYTDEEVLQLPDVTKDHPHYLEWKMRKESCNRLKHHFEKRLSSLKILEVGCGNGWLARQLAEIPGSKVTGIDVNFAELQQAVRVFNYIPNLQFISGGSNAKELEDAQYDFIVFAASIQYFPSLEILINTALRKLKPKGEIHILDSPFYETGELNAAKKRTEGYFTNLGFPEMTAHYFHHTMAELDSFPNKILYRPSFINHRILNNKNPFPWFCLKKY
jgi:SAM-dependent methyltransferase